MTGATEALVDDEGWQRRIPGAQAGFWLEELAAPYFIFRDAGVDITLASPKGGQPPLDPKSNEPAFQTGDTRRFEQDPRATRALADTVKLSDIDQAEYDSAFFPGGHGRLWDLTNDRVALNLIEDMLAEENGSEGQRRSKRPDNRHQRPASLSEPHP